jgi:uncharacterized protein YbjT (DUF2867 family)
MTEDAKRILVLGGTGKTGRRVAKRLIGRGVPTRVGSRVGDPPFDWNDRSTWAPALQGVRAVYVSYYPDLAVPGAVETVGAFADLAVESGVPRLVLLAGLGEPEAEHAEEAVRDSGAALTILRATWFAQSFSEDYLREQVLRGEVTVPAGEALVPFVDAEDIADVAFAALTGDAHIGRLYELSGPRLQTFGGAVEEIAQAAGREIRYVSVTMEEHAAASAEQGVPGEVIELLTYLFGLLLDGRYARLGDGMQRALGREATDFGEYARGAAATGAWRPSAMAA